MEQAGIPCSPASALPLPSWHGCEGGGRLWQEGMAGNLELSPCPRRNLGSGGCGDCSPSLSSVRAVPGFGVSLILGVQLCRRGDPSLGMGKEPGVMSLCFRMLVLFLFRGRARLLPWYFPY